MRRQGVRRQRAHGRLDIGHHDRRPRDGTQREDGRRSGSDRVGRMIVTVGVLPRQRREDDARTGLARVDDQPVGNAAAVLGGDDDPVHGFGDLAQTQFDHDPANVGSVWSVSEESASIARSTSRSSKG